MLYNCNLLIPKSSAENMSAFSIKFFSSSVHRLRCDVTAHLRCDVTGLALFYKILLSMEIFERGLSSEVICVAIKVLNFDDDAYVFRCFIIRADLTII